MRTGPVEREEFELLCSMVEMLSVQPGMPLNADYMSPYPNHCTVATRQLLEEWVGYRTFGFGTHG